MRLKRSGDAVVVPSARATLTSVLGAATNPEQRIDTMNSAGIESIATNAFLQTPSAAWTVAQLHGLRRFAPARRRAGAAARQVGPVC